MVLLKTMFSTVNKIARRLFIFIALLLFSYIRLYSQQPNSNAIKFSQLLINIENFYVENVNDTTLTEKAIKAVLKNLDPHSVYFTKKELEKSQEPLDGKFDGVGIQFNILKDTLLVVTPLAGGPSEKVGILAGDKIIKVDTSLVAGVGLTNRDVFKYLRGRKGTKVTLHILRSGSPKLLPFIITRDAIPIHSVVASYMVKEDIGYIKIINFSKKTISEFNEALIKLKRKGMKKLIVDLQNNGGGYLSVATKLVSKFIEKNKLIVFTEGLNSPKKEYLSFDFSYKEETTFKNQDLVILINEASASSSEILSGAIQDYDRGLIVGRRSFGKGLVQKTYGFIDGSAIRLTVSKYYTPSGRCIQKSYNNGIDKYHEELYQRVKSGEVYGKKKSTFPDSLKFVTLNKKRTVYGGGGISPDVFVPIDTSFSSTFYSTISRKGYINEFALKYTNNNRKNIKKNYPQLDSFIKSSDLNKKLITSLRKFLKKKKQKINEKELTTSLSLIEIRIKSSIANSIYGIESSYKVINQLNSSLNKAVELLSKKDKLEIK